MAFPPFFWLPKPEVVKEAYTFKCCMEIEEPCERNCVPSYAFECIGVILKRKIKLSLQSHQTTIINFELLYFYCLKLVDYLFSKFLKCIWLFKEGGKSVHFIAIFLNLI